jgi:hypothetical protein
MLQMEGTTEASSTPIFNAAIIDANKCNSHSKYFIRHAYRSENMHGEGSERCSVDCFIARAMQGPRETRSQIENAVRTVGLEVGYDDQVL